MEEVNQEDTRGGAVMERWAVRQLQDLADDQNCETIRRFDPAEVEPRIQSTTPQFNGLVSQNFIIPEAKRKTRTQHAPSIAEVGEGQYVATWFAGTWERMGDIGIWVARFNNGKWRKAKLVGKPKFSDEFNAWAPCWNPALLYNPDTETLLLFYKVGLPSSLPRVACMCCVVMTSRAVAADQRFFLGKQ